MRSKKKPLSSLPFSRLFAAALFFIGLTLTISLPSSLIVFADDAARAASSGYNFVTTSGATPSIPTSIQEEDEESPLRVAFVKPSFTFAAYQLNGFYNFYEKARDQAEGTTDVRTDLNLLTVRVPDGPYLNYKDDPFDSPKIPSQQQYYDTLRELIEEKSSSQNLGIDIADITDKEVDEGSIFDSAGNNVYDVLF